MKKSILAGIQESISDLRQNLGLAIDALHIDTSAVSLQALERIDGRLGLLIDGRTPASAKLTYGITELQLDIAEQKESSMKQERLAILDWLSPLDFGPKHNDSRSKWQEGTGRCLIKAAEFQEWLNRVTKTLWCPGMPGAGITILTYVQSCQFSARND